MDEALDDPTEPFALADRAAGEIRDRLGVERHQVALILGSGWGATADRLGPSVAEVDLSSIPGFPAPAVGGHQDVLRSIDVEGRPTLLFGGRVHLYEGYSPAEVVHSVRTAAAAGCEQVIVTNAAGAIDRMSPVGLPVLIADHLNLTGASPLVGPAPPPDRPSRFSDMTEAYSLRLRTLAREAEPTIPEGVYAGLVGGSYETPAEIRMLRAMGADLVGMSTVLETIAARHLGLEVLGISLVTNLAAGITGRHLDHQEVLDTAAQAQRVMVDLMRGVITRL